MRLRSRRRPRRSAGRHGRWVLRWSRNANTRLRKTDARVEDSGVFRLQGGGTPSPLFIAQNLLFRAVRGGPVSGFVWKWKRLPARIAGQPEVFLSISIV